MAPHAHTSTIYSMARVHGMLRHSHSLLASQMHRISQHRQSPFRAGLQVEGLFARPRSGPRNIRVGMKGVRDAGFKVKVEIECPLTLKTE